jgi:aspartate 4-decarboxylase
MAADSRDVGLNHTAGLSPPQQAMMTLFALSELMDRDGTYRDACRAILRRRSAALLRALGIVGHPNPLFDHYYGLIDLEYWLRTHFGEEVAAWVTRNVHPLDLVFRLAEQYGIVLLNGGGFHAPEWSARVSFANLPDAAYEEIGRAIRAIAEDYALASAAARSTATSRTGSEPGHGL